MPSRVAAPRPSFAPRRDGCIRHERPTPCGLGIFREGAVVVGWPGAETLGIGMMPMLNVHYAWLAGAPGLERMGSQ